MKDLALFDFDGTITVKDSLLEIARYSSKTTHFYLKVLFLLPSILLMKLGIINNQKGKEQFLKTFFGKKNGNEFNMICQNFAQKKIPELIRQSGLAEIQSQLSNGNRVVIVSASPENWIKPWAEPLGIEVIATKLKFENDQLKGIDGINCNGEEKVRRIKVEINLHEFDKVIAYGDTKGDFPMLALADEKHYKPFR